MPSIDDAFSIAQALDPADRIELIARLWETIPPKENWTPSDNDLAEVNRRWAEYEAGKVKAIPWETVRDEIRQRLASHD
jgi:putative addiction module component (TIGR02574 family)